MDEAWERAVEAALGGQAESSSSPPRPRSLTLDGSVKCLHGRLPPPEILERYQSLEHLSIANIGVSSLEMFPRLRNLQRLILSDNRIAGGLEHLVEAGLGSLRDLDLSNNKIQFLEDLASLAQLRLVCLDLYECPVTRIKDYRPRVFGMIRTLKYLDKMDADENERPESDEEEEDEDDDEEEEDPGSGEVDGEERPERLTNGVGTSGAGRIVDMDEEEESDTEDEDIGIGRGTNANGSERQYRHSNGFRLAPIRAASAVREEDEEDEEEDVDDDYEDNEEDLGEEIDAEEGEEENVVQVHEIGESDEDDDGVEEDGEEEFDEDEEEYEDREREEDQEDIEEEEYDGEPRRSSRPINMEGEIDGHEQGEGDEDENGEIREDDENGEIREEDEQEVDDDRYSEEDAGDRVEDLQDIEDEEDDGEPGSSGRLMMNAEGEIDGHEQGEGDEDENENGEIGEEDEQEMDDEEGAGEDEYEDEETGGEYLVQPIAQPGNDTGNEDEDEVDNEEDFHRNVSLPHQPSSSRSRKRRAKDDDLDDANIEDLRPSKHR